VKHAIRLFTLLATVSLSTSVTAEELAPIESVEIKDRAFSVNGKPFFPLMIWLQDAKNFPAAKACGMNTVAGYWPGSSGTKDVAGYLALVEKAGFYGVMPRSDRLKGHSHLLGYIHGDEPDLPRQVNDAEIVPAQGLKINRGAPLWKLVDGVWHSWSVLDPMEGASLTIRLRQPVTVESIAVWVTTSPGLAVAKEVSFHGDAKEILTATLEVKKGEQKFPLAKPATFRELKITVDSAHPGQHAWGSIGEIAAMDAKGRNVLLAPPRHEPRAQPEETLEEYRAIKRTDPSRPVFMTVTGYFHPQFGKWTDEQRKALYPAYVEATDVIGYDIYPIYGWNKPEWIHLVNDATARLTELAGPRPVYAWIETSKGGQWTGPLEKQADVTPRHIRAEVWMAVCNGATGIGYFTHVWKPSYDQFGVPEANRKEIRRINDQITRLTPAIIGGEPSGKMNVRAEGDVKISAMTKVHDGRLYVFAVNYDERLKQAEATITVEGLPPGREVEVVDEGRTITTRAGSFSDSFDPLAVHIYRVALPR